MAIELYLAGAWVDITADVANVEVDGQFGISGNGPKDRLAEVGTLTFTLNNGPDAVTGRPRGYYSPLHANRRTDFTDGTLCRVRFTYDGTIWPRFYGKIADIDPAPGVRRSQHTKVTVHDLMDDLVETDLRNVTVQLNQTEAQLITTIITALPAGAQPVSLDLDTGLDTSPFAFDNLGEGEKAVTPIADLLMSSLGFGYMLPTGIFYYENRQARQTKVSTFTLDNTMVELTVRTTRDEVYDRIRATYHPKTVDAAATTVLWSMRGTAPAIAPGQTITIWGDYYKAADPDVKIGGTAQVTPVATTDYMANSAANGSGTNKTANITVVATPFSSTVKFDITNGDAATVYLVDGSGNPKLQIRGKGLYDEAPQTVESGTGHRALNVDLPYQTNFNITQDLVDYLLAQYQDLGTQPESVTFIGNRSDAHMRAALGASIGDRITVIEEQTGVVGDSFIQSIHWTAIPRGAAGPLIRCTFGLASATFFDAVWIMDDAALSLIDTSTYFGYA